LSLIELLPPGAITLRSLFDFAQAPSVGRTRFLSAARRHEKKHSSQRRIRYRLTASLVAHYVDLHTHFLPGLDDGADSLATCLSMVRGLAEMGFSDLCATPHQFAGLFEPSLDEVRLTFDQVSRETATVLPEVRLLLGAENYWDDVFASRLRRGDPPCYDGGKAFLFEVSPAAMPPRLEEALFDIRVAGRLAVLAHPERYSAVQRDPAVAEGLGRQAALLVDLAALSGTGDRAEVKTARRLVEEGLAHAAASDMHDPGDSPAIAAGLAWIEKRLGTEVVRRLLSDNPRRILIGELP
jgi:protein-tyrosine phosphatase